MSLLLQSIILAICAGIMIVLAIIHAKPLIAVFAFITWLLAIFSAVMDFIIKRNDESTYSDKEDDK